MPMEIPSRFEYKQTSDVGLTGGTVAGHICIRIRSRTLDLDDTQGHFKYNLSGAVNWVRPFGLIKMIQGD